MRKTVKTTAGILAATVVLGGVIALCQDNDYYSMGPTAWEWPDNSPTNKIVVPTVKLYTNTQAAVANDQQYRVRQEGVTGKGAAGLQSGPRIETRPPTAYLQADPWVQPDHPWDVNPGMPIAESLGITNNTVIDETRR